MFALRKTEGIRAMFTKSYYIRKTFFLKVLQGQPTCGTVPQRAGRFPNVRDVSPTLLGRSKR
jgi:hypothetical protein